MKLVTARARFWFGAALVLVLSVAGFLWVGLLIPRWNATADEAGRALPGDEIIPQPQITWNHAITIRATPTQIYPWLAQIGDSRAGYYSFTFIENLFMTAAQSGDRYVNADRVHPEWQNPSPGQGIIVDALAIQETEPDSYVLASATPTLGEVKWTWLWYLQPLDGQHTRLIVRHRFWFPPEVPSGVVRVMLDAGYVMERGMILGIRERAEGRIPPAWEQPLGALLWLVALAAGLVAAVQFVRQPGRMLQLGLGLVALALLFVYTFIQPPIWLRAALDLALIAGLFLAARRKGISNSSSPT